MSSLFLLLAVPLPEGGLVAGWPSLTAHQGQHCLLPRPSWLSAPQHGRPALSRRDSWIHLTQLRASRQSCLSSSLRGGDSEAWGLGSCLRCKISRGG